ncbi:MAG: CrcB family protein [Actinobacteria bacterium]|nr:CrcB family protein [Actinomycetota bacterium]
MTAFLLVAVGGALGAVVRYVLVTHWSGRFPWSILVANLAGSFGLGVLLGSASPGLLLFAGVGFCGALTTFSTFALDTLVLVREGRVAASAGNVATSLAGSVIAVIAGMMLVGAMGL